MELVSRLQNIYGENIPIFLDEIKTTMSEYSASYIFRCVREAIAKEQLARFDESVYYIPTDTILGKSTLNSYRVIEKKYIKQNGKTIGFYSGIGLLNGIGGTRQMPNIYEIVTNRETTRKREVSFGGGRLILRKPRCEVVNDNVKILQVLELCNKYLWDEEAIEAVLNYAKSNKVTERDILQYAKYYPARAVKNAIEVLYGIA
jgi:hypothetical protein